MNLIATSFFSSLCFPSMTLPKPPTPNSSVIKQSSSIALQLKSSPILNYSSNYLNILPFIAKQRTSPGFRSIRSSWNSWTPFLLNNLATLQLSLLPNLLHACFMTSFKFKLSLNSILVSSHCLLMLPFNLTVSYTLHQAFIVRELYYNIHLYCLNNDVPS